MVYSIARLMYGYGYMRSPKGRVAGALLQDVALLGMIYLGYASAYRFIAA